MRTDDGGGAAKTSERTTTRRVGRVGALGVLGLLGAGLLMGGRARPVAAEEGGLPRRVLPVKTETVQEEPRYQVDSRFVGRVEAARSSALGFELPGTVTILRVDEGESVAAGEVIAELDTARLAARRTELSAGLSEARAGKALAESTHSRVAKLVNGGSVSRQRLDEARSELDTAAAAVARIEAQLEAVEVDFEKSVLRAPYEAVVVERRVDEGSVLPAGTPVVRLLETGNLEVRVGLTPEAAGTVAPGQEIEVVAGPGRRVAAKVVRIVPERSAATRTIDVLLSVNAGSGLQDGDLVELVLPRLVEDAGFWVDRVALTESVRGLWAVYALVPTEEEELFTVERRQLEILHQDGERLFVRGALVDGDRIVGAGMHRLVPGQHVTESPVIETAGN